ncbi:MAG: molybdenum cofactor guanylyltransferase [Candidatus Omnitrophota bacterium]
MHTTHSITGIILAGGVSRRMGSDKAFLRLGSTTVIEELIGRLKNVFVDIVCIANDREKYEQFGIPTVADRIPGKGPIGGIYTGLLVSRTPSVFVFACDAPFVHEGLINSMIRRANEGDIIVPKWNGRLEPLHAIYSKKCIDPIEYRLRNNELKMSKYVSDSNAVILEKELKMFQLGQNPFRNLNTPDDYEAALAESRELSGIPLRHIA